MALDEVVKAVREQVHAGSDLVKIMATGGVMTPGVNPEDAHYSAEEMKAGISEAHRFHKCCASHAQGALGILNAVRGGIDSIEHGIFMTDECITRDEGARRVAGADAGRREEHPQGLRRRRPLDPRLRDREGAPRVRPPHRLDQDVLQGGRPHRHGHRRRHAAQPARRECARARIYVRDRHLDPRSRCSSRRRAPPT